MSFICTSFASFLRYWSSVGNNYTSLFSLLSIFVVEHEKQILRSIYACIEKEKKNLTLFCLPVISGADEDFGNTRA